jgi:hypothetical protein
LTNTPTVTSPEDQLTAALELLGESFGVRPPEPEDAAGVVLFLAVLAGPERLAAQPCRRGRVDGAWYCYFITHRRVSIAANVSRLIKLSFGVRGDESIAENCGRATLIRFVVVQPSIRKWTSKPGSKPDPKAVTTSFPGDSLRFCDALIRAPGVALAFPRIFPAVRSSAAIATILTMLHLIA